MLEDGRLSMGHARSLLAIEQESRMISLAEEILANQWSVRETEKAVKRAASSPSENSSPKATSPGQNDANIRAAELKLKRYLGTQVHIHLAQQNAGRIEIEFTSMSDLDRLYNLIMRRSESSPG